MATFHVALWVLGAVLLAQFTAVAWAVIGPGKKDRFTLRSAPEIDTHSEIGEPDFHLEFPGELGTSLPPFSDSEIAALPSDPPLPPIGPNPLPPLDKGSTIPPELGGSGTPGSPRFPLSLENPKTGSEEPYRIVPASARLRSPEVLGIIAAAVNLRGAGDTQGALESLRRADAIRPENPRILHEIATTYHHMGLREKAVTCWQRVLEMGESGAGDYYALADIQISEGKVSPPQGEPIAAIRGIISIGDIVANRDTAVQDGEKILVRIPIFGKDGKRIQPEKVAAYIYFFDLVEGRLIEQTTSRTEILQNWSSPPIDWSSSAPESLDVTYYQRTPLIEPGAPTPQERRYYGYIIRLFYDNILQDVVASPRTLIDFNPAEKNTNPQLDDALFGR